MAAREAYLLYVERAAEGANEVDGPFSAACQRRSRKKARMSATSASGSSRAAKWPPAGISVQRLML